MTSIISKIKNNVNSIQIIDEASKTRFYCAITNKMLSTEHDLDRFLFLSYYQGIDEVKEIYKFAETEYYEDSPYKYKKFITDNINLKCYICGFIFDVFPGIDLFNGHKCNYDTR